MKYFLVIPALLLFLSNIPFIHTMDREEMMAAMKKDGCCKKSGDSKKTCEPPAKSCHKPAKEEKPCKDGKEKQCGMMNESTCICICCFQFAAPDQLGSKFQFGIKDLQQSLAIYLQQTWKDPQLALPWQPPDLIS